MQSAAWVSKTMIGATNSNPISARTTIPIHAASVNVLLEGLLRNYSDVNEYVGELVGRLSESSIGKAKKMSDTQERDVPSSIDSISKS